MKNQKNSSNPTEMRMIWPFKQPVTMAEAMVVGMDSIVRIDPTVAEVADLPPGWTAERDAVGAEWRRSPSVWDDDEE